MFFTAAFAEISSLKLNLNDWILFMEVDVEDGILNWSVTKLLYFFTYRIRHENA